MTAASGTQVIGTAWALALGASIACTDRKSSVASTAAKDAWVQVWSDEFDGAPGAPVDSATWRYDTGDGCREGICGWGNNEKQYYTDAAENIALNGQGQLMIVARRAPAGLSCHYGPCRYTSAKVTTRGKRPVAPGRVEARIKLPAGQGLWPAFWMLGQGHPRVPWPLSGELDVMENRGSEPTTSSSAVHGPGYSGKTPFAHAHSLARGTLSDDFHTFSVEWDSLHVRFFVDDTAHYRVARSALQQFGKSVLDQPFYLNLNLAVGGQFDGDPRSDAIFPATMLVDYVRVYARKPQPDDSIRSSLRTVDIQSGRIETVYAADRHFEAPNWSPDGLFFVVNSKGRLYRVAAIGDKRLDEIPTGFATRANNDHGISPDGRYLVLSHHAEEHITDPAQDWLASSIYIVPITGGSPIKVTTKAPSFWHGWSPDGKTLAFVGRRNDEWDIYAIPVDGGEERRLTTCRGLDDGPDYSPDGKFIYYNSFCSGRMQIWRMRPDGSQPEQLTRDAYSSWFPHPSPDGRWVVFIAYLEDQEESHPFGKQVKLRLMDLRDGSVRDLTAPFFGGQGTINVPSWSPDSRRVAFVVYERDLLP